MVAVTRTFPNILSGDLIRARDFYVNLLGLKVSFDSDWFVSLESPSDAGNELGIWRRDHELIPERFQRAPQGVAVSFVVDDVDAVYAAAVEQGLQIVAPPRDLFYGQRQFLTTDPDGTLVDVSAPCAASEEFTASLVQDGDTFRQTDRPNG